MQRVNKTHERLSLGTIFEVVCADGAMATLITRLGRRDTIESSPPLEGDKVLLEGDHSHKTSVGDARQALAVHTLEQHASLR